MSWLKIDDGFADHPKLLELSDAAFRLHVRAMCWCARQETDGLLTSASQRALGAKPKLVSELERAALWDREGDSHRIHDYLEYNPSAERLEREREMTRERVKRFRNGVTAPPTDHPSNTRVTALHSPLGNGVTTAAPTRPDPLPKSDQIPPIPPCGGKPVKPAKKPRKIQTEVSEWPGPTEAHRALAASLRVNLSSEAQKMRDWAQAKGERKVDWNAAFNGWIRRAAEQRPAPPGLAIHRQFQANPAELPAFDAMATARRVAAEMAAEKAETERRRRAAEALREAANGR